MKINEETYVNIKKSDIENLIEICRQGLNPVISFELDATQMLVRAYEYRGKKLDYILDFLLEEIPIN